MKKIEFRYYRGHNDIIKEVFEYPDDITDIEIDADYEFWVWNIIGDNCSWEEIE